MCGIAGFAGFEDEPLLRAMSDSLSHRGPDDAGFYNAPGVGLTQRRLAVIDLATGHQPLANEAGDVWVVFNGEIYNYEALRESLKQKGHTLRTSSDTETIVHLYEDFGVDFVDHLRGMFAIALWDVRRRRLVLSRDRIGEKPIFYAERDGRLLFGSEIKAILQAQWGREVDPQAVCDYLAAGYVTGFRSFYRGISRLPPAHQLVFEDGRASVRRYWQRPTAIRSDITFESAAEELSSRLDETARLCLKSDVEVGAFLSGGIDSSMMVALMRQHEAHVKTFCVGYRGLAVGFNELRFARAVAERLGSDHHELILEAGANIGLLPRILWHYDEPHGEPTSVLVYQLCEFTRRKVKVALSGTGGDEIFFGYPRHRGISALEYYRHVPAVIRRHVVDRLVALWPESTRGSRFVKRVRRFVVNSELPADEAYLNWVCLLHRDIRAALLTDRVRAEAADPAGDAALRRFLLGPADRPLLRRASALDVEAYLPDYQLCYMDRMSMAHGLEARSPLCDYELVNFVTSLPEHYRLKGQRSKHIFKHVAGKWLPREIVERPKVGFDSPIGEWFKGELRPFLASFLAPDQVRRTGLLEPVAVERLVADHMAGRRDYSLQIWSVVALEAWARMYLEDRVTDGRAYQAADLRGMT